MDIIGEGEIMTETKETAIVKREVQELAKPTGNLPSAQNLRMLAQDLLNSGMFPAVKNVAGAVTIIEYGRELSIPPVAALQTMAIVNGRLCMEAKAMQAIFQNHGGDIKIIERSKVRAKIELSKVGREPYVHEYTMEQAKQEKLSGKDNWTKMPETMLYWRAVATGIRLYDPGVIFGLYSKEELTDIAVPSEKQDNPGRGIATHTGEPVKTQPSASQAVKTATPQPDTAFFGGEDHPEAVVEGELLDDDGKEAPVDDGFFGGEKGGAVEGASVEPSEDLLFTDDAIAGIVSAIKDALKVEGVDEKAFKAWLAEVGPKKNPPRKYVGLKFGHQSLSAGNVNDLKRLHGEIHAAIKTFKRGAK